MLRKPTCSKCGSKNTYLEVPRFHPEEVHLGCFSCGWRIYGEERIQSFVYAYNEELQKKDLQEKEMQRKIEEKRKAAIEKKSAELKAKQDAEERKRSLKRERDRRYRLRKKAKSQTYIIPELDTTFQVGDMDPVLQVPWALPEPNKEGEHFHPCAWPPCGKRARANSKYCSRTCTVKVAHRRANLRKKGKLRDRKAS